MIFSSRSKKLLLGIVGSVGTRSINLLVSAAMVPLAIAGLGTSDYAVFAVVLSLATLFAFSDLGLGMAIVNHLSRTSDTASEVITDTVSRILAFLSSIGIVVIIIMLAALGIAPPPMGMSTSAYIMMTLCIGFGIPAGLSLRILFALQRNLELGLWSVGSRIVGLLGIALCSAFSLPLYCYVFAVLGVPAVASIICLVTLLFDRTISIRIPNKDSFNLLVRDIGDGFRFLIMQFGMYCDIALDVILIAAFLPSFDLARFDVSTRLFAYIPTLTSLLFLPLWPALASAIHNNDTSWVKSVLRWSMVGACVLSIASAGFIILCYDAIIPLWTGHELSLPMLYVVPISMLYAMIAFGQAQASIIVGQGGIRSISLAQLFIIAGLIFVKIITLMMFGVLIMLWACVIYYVVRIAINYIIMRGLVLE